jgi:hypothetical protein
MCIRIALRSTRRSHASRKTQEPFARSRTLASALDGNAVPTKINHRHISAFE